MKKILNILFLMVMTVSLFSQTTLTFEGKDRTGQDYVQLSRVSVFDLDQLWHQEIFYPDTTLVLYVNGTVGVETMCTSSLQMQNNPNPFDGTTDVVLSTPYEGDVTMEITDVNGRAVVGANNYSPQPGTHQFRLTLSAPGTYVLTARQNGRTVSVKMVNAGNGGSNGIEYMGVVETTHALSLQPKSGTRGNGNYPFHNGDLMRYTGYAVVDDVEIESQTVDRNQNGSETIPLKFDVARPEVVTNAASNIAASAATLNGEVTDDNNANVTERGFCWKSGAGTPTLDDSHVIAGSGTGAFQAQTTDNLQPGTTYSVRAYATNVVGTGYGSIKQFTAASVLPTVVTNQPTNADCQAFVGSGEVTYNGGATITTRGLCWNTTGMPTITDSHTVVGSGMGTFTANVTGLQIGTTYFVRAYATNNAGTSYGEEKVITTLPSMLPEVNTLSATLYHLSALIESEVTNEHCLDVTSRGNCWNTTGTPTTDDEHTVNGQGIGSFIDTLTNLTEGTTYYVRTYATNGVGTSYGQEIVITAIALPTVVTATVDDIVSFSATCGGNVTADGGNSVTDRGICWNTEGNPTVSDNHTNDGSGLGNFFSSMMNLMPGITYYVRAYATNIAGTAYGQEVSFTTMDTLPRIVTAVVSNIGATIAHCGGDVIADGGATVNVRGVCWNTMQNPTITDSHTTDGTGTGNFTSNLTGLAPGATYYVRAYATNNVGTVYGEQRSFTTMDTLPSVTTTMVSDISYTTTTCGGNVVSDGGAAVTARGVCWNTSHNPTISGSHTTNGNGTGDFISSMTGLTDGTTYYVRAYATNSVGTAYGEELTFTTLQIPCGTATLTDRDNNTYNTVLIGSQCWMKENLRTKKYADGISIAQGTGISDSEPYWYYPNNSSSNQTTYGLLYNWPAVMRGMSSSSTSPSGVQGICPTGWHVPSDAEWTQLQDYVCSQSQFACVNYYTYFAKALAGTIGWNSSTNTCAVGNTPSQNDATGFSALPAGYYHGNHNSFGSSANFWSATETVSLNAKVLWLFYNRSEVSFDDRDKSYGFSVRCVKN